MTLRVQDFDFRFDDNSGADNSRTIDQMALIASIRRGVFLAWDSLGPEHFSE
jgi:hypothetical protein